MHRHIEGRQCTRQIGTMVFFREGDANHTLVARFDTVGGTITLDPAHPEKSSVTATIAASSVNTGVLNTAGARAFDTEIHTQVFGSAANPNITFVLQPYGSLFFAAAPVFEAALPAVDEQSRRTVVILRLRGRSDLGTTFMDVLRRYAVSLQDVGSKLVIVSDSDRVLEQLIVTNITDTIGDANLYAGDERVGATVRRAHDDAVRWIAERPCL